MEIFTRSLHKHNKHFTQSDLLFLACFAEHETSSMVAKLFLGVPFPQPADTDVLYPKFHHREINLLAFYNFLQDECKPHIADAKKTINYNLTKDAIRTIAERDIWDGSIDTEQHCDLFLQYYAALPSNSHWVERAVKKAKLCQKTGKGERNVTNVGIAGNYTNEMYTEQTVQTNYPERMKKKRQQQQERASNEGREPRSSKEYTEDLKRGPSCTRNIINHAHKQSNK